MSLKFRLSACFLIFLGAQLAVSFTHVPTYPLNAYRMFSKNWKVGITMERVVFSSGGREYSPGELFRVPFFQGNQASYVTFGDPSSEAQRKALCQVAFESGVAGPIEVSDQDVVFARGSDKKIEPRTARTQVAYVCR
jgi:hypothetical protein